MPELHHLRIEVWLKEYWTLETTSVAPGSVTVNVPVMLTGCGIISEAPLWGLKVHLVGFV